MGPRVLRGTPPGVGSPFWEPSAPQTVDRQTALLVLGCVLQFPDPVQNKSVLPHESLLDVAEMCLRSSVQEPHDGDAG